MTEEIIIDEQDTTEKYKNKEIDCLHFCCKKGDRGSVLFWCEFYDDYCDNYNGCYYRKYLRLEQENEKLKKEVKQIGSDFIKKGDYARKLEQENKALQAYKDINEDFKQAWDELNEKYKQLRSALEEIMESAKFAQCMPCGSGNLEDCLNCDDEITNNGQFCMEKRIYEIKTKCVEVLTP